MYMLDLMFAHVRLLHTSWSGQIDGWARIRSRIGLQFSARSRVVVVMNVAVVGPHGRCHSRENPLKPGESLSLPLSLYLFASISL